MGPLRLGITGMTCTHCATTIAEALNDLPGLKACVSYPDRAAYIEALGSSSIPTILEAIETVGYRALPVTDLVRAQSPSHKTGGESAHRDHRKRFRGFRRGHQSHRIRGPGHDGGIRSAGRHMRERGVHTLEDPDPRGP